MNKEELIVQQELLDVQTQHKSENNLNWKHLLWFILLYTGAVISAAILFVIILLFFQRITGNYLLFLIKDYYGLLFDALIVLVIFLKYKPIQLFVVKSIDFTVLKAKKTYLYILVALFASLAVQYIILDLFHIEDASKQADKLGINGNKVFGWFSYLLMYIAIGVITPIKEEFIFRGILYRFFEQRYSFWIGLIVSSVIFGGLHFDTPLTGFFMGSIFALLYHFSRSLVPPVIVHILWNLYSTIILSING